MYLCNFKRWFKLPSFILIWYAIAKNYQFLHISYNMTMQQLQWWHAPEYLSNIENGYHESVVVRYETCLNDNHALLAFLNALHGLQNMFKESDKHFDFHFNQAPVAIQSLTEKFLNNNCRSIICHKQEKRLSGNSKYVLHKEACKSSSNAVLFVLI